MTEEQRLIERVDSVLERIARKEELKKEDIYTGMTAAMEKALHGYIVDREKYIMDRKLILELEKIYGINSARNFFIDFYLYLALEKDANLKIADMKRPLPIEHALYEIFED